LPSLEGAPPSTAEILRAMGETVPAHIADAAVVAVHPTQLYEMALASIMFVILWRLGAKPWLRTGQLFAAYMVLYGIERFGIEFVRAKSDRLFIAGIGFSTSQIASILLAGVGAFLWWRRGRVGNPAPLAVTSVPTPVGGGTGRASRMR
jgi:prolipoprotein diacylglyceryltransferase